MKTIWMNIVAGWNVMKIIRVITGLLVLVSGISEHNTVFALLGTFLLFYSLATPGTCCATYNISRDDSPVDKRRSNDELDSK